MKMSAYLAPLVLAFVLVASHADAIGKLGDPAGPLSIAEWVKGTPVDMEKAKGKNFVVVEFWATWCGPCRESIPHLTELQKKFKDKGMLAVGISEEETSEVRPFVNDMGEKMDYSVARDNSGKTAEAYMTTFGLNGIPSAFVVDKQGIIVWFGHPLDPQFEKTLTKLADGTFNLAESIKASEELKEKREHFKEYFTLASSGSDHAKADLEGKWLIEKGENDSDLLTHLALGILLSEDLKYRDTNFAMRVATKANQLTKGADALALHAYALSLFETGKIDDAIKYQKDAIKANKEERLNKALSEALTKFEAAKTGAPVKSPAAPATPLPAPAPPTTVPTK